MLFNSLVFVVFLIVVVVGHWALPKLRWQNYFLLVTSLFFYGYGDYRFLALLLFSTVVSYGAALAMARFPAYRKLALWLGVSICLALLFVFKYYDFFVTAVAASSAAIGLPLHPATLRIALPIGISFFTFQAIGYMADVYRGRSAAEADFATYLLFKAFFPQLVAGPIERSSNLLRQIKLPRRLTPGDVTYGCWYILQGYVKKIVIADNLAPMVNLIFAQDDVDGSLVFAALLGFAFQIYGDFSGYTDIARGVARLLGFRLLLNFWHPYRARNPADFWRRWHITLSNWFRDYVYIPLGGNRLGGVRTATNLFATMTLSGLWHGAALNFVLWGAYHGLLLVAHRGLAGLCGWRGEQAHGVGAGLARAAMFLCTLYGWMLFRVTDVDRIVDYTVALCSDWSASLLGALVLAQMAVFIVMALVIDAVEARLVIPARHKLRAGPWLAPAYATMVAVILVFIASVSGEFIYFKF